MTTWHKGPPPSIGWWPASDRQNPDVLRWWNGASWSAATHIGMTVEEAAYLATVKTWERNIEWADRPASWPERSYT